MSTAFDLASYNDMRANAVRMLAKLPRTGRCPCNGPWPQERAGLFHG
jgi:hypothetical protein